jgi:hypothetical protein
MIFLSLYRVSDLVSNTSDVSLFPFLINLFQNVHFLVQHGVFVFPFDFYFFSCISNSAFSSTVKNAFLTVISRQVIPISVIGPEADPLLFIYTVML